MSPFFILLILPYAVLCTHTTLQLLHIISRHGARTPIILYPNDPNKNHRYKEGLGQLTNTGKLQQYALGKYFRKRYHNFITSNPREDLLDYVSYYSGQTIDDWKDALYVIDAIKIERRNGAVVPHWAVRVYRRLEKIFDDFFYFSYKSLKMQRLRAGPLIGDIVERMKEKDEGKLNNLTKVYAYFTHDANVAALLGALKIFNGKAPPFGATVLVELHKFGDSTCVKVFYSNSSSPERDKPDVRSMKLPDCPSECCPLRAFINITRPLVPVDWENECKLPMAGRTSGCEESLCSGKWTYYLLWFGLVNRLYSF
ncbi:testicular acid phosphatase homolog isoform X2 [Centruroides sculpturatus]|uniref:testicular acid phosphatase homolog isoform X2 n=1 Tax=Centruroides sculpturatus TaxID=218467 RepID=UPI000C6D6E50|nr:testicular acid phosphatase homolog isoform X2 [Centruroides sculpturatus]